MTKDPDQVVVRLPADLLTKLDALAERLGSVDVVSLSAGSRGVTRSVALRLALAEGIAVLNARYPAKRGR